ncbi:hypothetical protein H072_428 [Dactylellina haptotyla CBS 200.50]|uniref:Extracellular membrane protein CFEM domain-containing protein n=1 Tax=Dactylellina haptotyla (strain CBS 200.50) TaxID=1284197 RepID=S8AX12_DACHA|nr:hypothetical protein H072_428 [Dactylellina haptotyla CBS 200.50]
MWPQYSLVGYVMMVVALSVTTSQAQDACADACANYQTLLEFCQHDAGQEAIYLDCVCNDLSFANSNAACVACEGAGSAPDQFRQNCKSVPQDCTQACQLFSGIISGCTAGDASCVCAGAYDATYPNTFNQAFNDCAQCENGGGTVGSWEQRCCSLTGGCNGIVASNGGNGGGGTDTTSPVLTPTSTIPMATIGTVTSITTTVPNNSNSLAFYSSSKLWGFVCLALCIVHIL